SDAVNRLGDLSRPGAWPAYLRALAAALENVRLGLVEPEECAAVRSEVAAWAAGFSPEDRFGLLRLRASLARARRLAADSADRAEVGGRPGRLLVLLPRADGDAEIPAGVKGLALGEPIPHLSHLGVRARQAGVPVAACASPEHLDDFAALLGKQARLRVGP